VESHDVESGPGVGVGNMAKVHVHNYKKSGTLLQIVEQKIHLYPFHLGKAPFLPPSGNYIYDYITEY
jgi:hypothetical protein